MSSLSTISESDAGKSSPHEVLASTSKLQNFIGVDDIELKSEIVHNDSIRSLQKLKHNRRRSLKTILTLKNSEKKKLKPKFKRNRKKARSGLQRLRRKHKSKKSETSLKKSSNAYVYWKPTLSVIYKDSNLFQALIKCSEQLYNSENVLFLKSVQKLQRTKLRKVDAVIKLIYHKFIEDNAMHQINLSYDCSQEILGKYRTFTALSEEEKRAIFDECVKEIENLVITSILSAFYKSLFFQSIAKKSKYYTPKSMMSGPGHHKSKSL